LGSDSLGLPDYDQFAPTVAPHCAGTNHQDISGIEKVAYLGDSITAGTPPTPEEDYYRNQLTRLLETEGQPLEVVHCAAWGARTDDLLLEPHQQIHTCFPTPEPKRTLIVLTAGGNDMFAAAEALNEGQSVEEAFAVVTRAADLLREAITWIRDNEATHFPGGVSVVFTNIYEFTDATGDMSSCPSASVLGFDGQIPELRDGYLYISEQYMDIAVSTGTDMVFLLEQFCGHGFYAGDPVSECYRGPDTEIWFDGTCIHPNPAGHTAMANLFFEVISE